MLQALRHVIAAAIGVLANFAQARYGIPLDPGTQAGLVVAVYAVVEKLAKRLFPQSAGV